MLADPLMLAGDLPLVVLEGLFTGDGVAKTPSDSLLKARHKI